MKNQAAVELGRKGGQRKVKKGFARMSLEKIREAQLLGAKARRANARKKAK